MIISDLKHLEVISEAGIVGGSDAAECVSLRQNDGIISTTVTVTNFCPNRVRVKVDFAFAPDGACQTIEPEGTATERRVKGARADGIRNC